MSVHEVSSGPSLPLDYTEDVDLSQAFLDLVKVRYFLEEMDALEATLRAQIQRSMENAEAAKFKAGVAVWERAGEGWELKLKLGPTAHEEHLALKEQESRR